MNINDNVIFIGTQSGISINTKAKVVMFITYRDDKVYVILENETKYLSVFKSDLKIIK